MKILSASQVKAVDDYNIKKLGIDSLELMERASGCVAHEIAAMVPVTSKIVVFAGPGNNGGDGLAVSRLLADKGYHVETYLFNTGNRLSAECEANRERLGNYEGVVFHEIISQFDIPCLDETDVIVDALFGTCLSRPLTGGYEVLVEFINKSQNMVVSVDMPSGVLDISDSCKNVNRNGGKIVAVKADYTFTFHCLKPSMLLDVYGDYFGEIKVLDIGLDDGCVNYEESPFCLTELRDVCGMLRKRKPFSNKGTYGHGLLVSGMKGMAGAAVLSAKAAMRSGLGKITVHTPEINRQVVQISIPEAIVDVEEANCFTSRDLNVDEYDAVAVGPGLGVHAETSEALLALLKRKPTRLVLDADALNLLSSHAEWGQMLPEGTIITPHWKEWCRLAGVQSGDGSLLTLAMNYAAKYGIYIVLKGHRTVVCTPRNKVFFNTTGNPGMATAGSGDVLTGVLLALSANGYEPEECCRMGVWLHGTAGDMATDGYSEESLMASDIISNLGKAFNSIIDNKL